MQELVAPTIELRGASDEHYHVTIVSACYSVPPVVVADYNEAVTAYLRAIDGFISITGNKSLESTNQRTVFSDGTTIRIFRCSKYCRY